MEVTAARELESRNELLGDGGTADDVAAFEDGDGETGACEVCGSGKAVVAPADDQRIPFTLRQPASGAGAATEASSPHFLWRLRSSSSGNFQCDERRTPNRVSQLLQRALPNGSCLCVGIWK